MGKICRKLAVNFALAAGIAVAGGMGVPSPALAERDPIAPQLDVRNTGTASEKRIQALGSLVNKEDYKPHIPVAVFDRDWFNVNVALNNLGGDSHYRQRGQLVRIYTRKHAGADLDEGIASVIADEIPAGTEEAMPMGYRASRYTSSNGSDAKFCLLFPAREDLDAARYLRHMIAYTPEVYGSLYGTALTSPLTYQEYVAQISHHETGHCLDDRYFKAYLEQNEDYERDGFILNRHKSELFAEVAGVLLSIRLGSAADLAGRQSMVRYLDSWFRGRSLSRAGGFSGEQTAYAGSIYAFGPALEELQKDIDRRGAASIRALSVQQIKEFAYDVVERHAMTSTQIEAHHEALLNPGKAEQGKKHGPFISAYMDSVSRAFSALSGGTVSPERVRQTLLAETPGPMGADPAETASQFRNDVEKAAATDALVAQLQGAIGKRRADADSALPAYVKIRDALIQTLQGAAEDKRETAMRLLGVLPEALRQLLHGKARSIPSGVRGPAVPANS